VVRRVDEIRSYFERLNNQSAFSQSRHDADGSGGLSASAVGSRNDYFWN
jgi:hypothetical protein